MKVLIHPDSWVCLCGNMYHRTGFLACTIEGIPIPADCKICMGKPKYYRCIQCGRVVDAQTLEVVTSSMVLGFHWEEGRILPQWSVRCARECDLRNHAH